MEEWGGIGITEVFGWNLEEEGGRLLSSLYNFNTIALDTEYPGTIINTPQFAGEVERYRDLKYNVEKTNLIQVGLTVFNPKTDEIAGVWQFNLSGFNPEHHVHSPASIQMLSRSGINFQQNNSIGVKMWQFVHLLERICHGFADRVQWVTFHGLYDIAYLLAAVHGRWKLPEDIQGFIETCGEFFSGGIFDLKCMAGNRSWMGLEKLAKELGTTREQGCAHQSGSDSLLTAKAFIRALHCSLVTNLDDYRGRLFAITHRIPAAIPSPGHRIPIRCISVRFGHSVIVMEPCFI